MDKTFDILLGVCIGMLIISGFVFFCAESTKPYEIGYDYGYKQGQVDSINGIVKYKLTTNPDKTTYWKRIEK